MLKRGVIDSTCTHCEVSDIATFVPILSSARINVNNCTVYLVKLNMLCKTMRLLVNQCDRPYPKHTFTPNNGTYSTTIAES